MLSVDFSFDRKKVLLMLTSTRPKVNDIIKKINEIIEVPDPQIIDNNIIYTIPSTSNIIQDFRNTIADFGLSLKSKSENNSGKIKFTLTPTKERY